MTSLIDLIRDFFMGLKRCFTELLVYIGTWLGWKSTIERIITSDKEAVASKNKRIEVLLRDYPNKRIK